MAGLYIAIAVVAVLVVLTGGWSWRSGSSGSTQLRRRPELRRRDEERDLR
jgi:hypothetical protein